MSNYEISVRRLWPLLAGLVAAGVVVGAVLYALTTNSGDAAAGSVPVADAPTEPATAHEHGTDTDLRPVQVAVNTASPPLPFHEAPQGKVIVRVFDLLAAGTVTSQGYEEAPGLWDVVERNLNNYILPSGMRDFYDNVMAKGPWRVVGRPIASPPTTKPFSERGRLVEPRFVYLLINQGARYMQAKVQVDFLTYGDGRVLVSQAGLAIKEMKVLDESLVTKYMAAHGV